MEVSKRARRTTKGARNLAALNDEITACRLCPRLVEWRERVAKEKVKRFQGQEYWGKPVPSFGDPDARLLVLGLAPAAHGGNRTGRVFTGDSSGDWLYRALYRAGFANQPTSEYRGDGLRLRDCYISAVIHCAPPLNKPTGEEIRNCRHYLLAELDLLARLRVIVALGRIAFDAALAATASTAPDSCQNAGRSKTVKPVFKHGAQYEFGDGRILIASFHPSQQNTFTGKLT
ncbi:MAG TPA: uracil-DNA glycosylase, partial [Blastocatellia bacterium]